MMDLVKTNKSDVALVNYPYFSDVKELSQYEIKMRDFLMYDFNMSLKSILIKYNFNLLDTYFFNTCRQTAIFGALALNHFFPEYNYSAYEARFNDTLLGSPVSYDHCFIIAEHKELETRCILIDMARTTNPLVFEPINEEHFYPTIEEYKDLVMTEVHEIDYNKIYERNIQEFLTELPTQDFYDELLDFIYNYQKSMAEKEKTELVQRIYGYPFKKFEELKEELKLEMR